jgi:hypothetical protein
LFFLRTKSGTNHLFEGLDRRGVFYDINANFKLRRPIGEAFGLDPYERVSDYLEQRLAHG